MKLEKVELVDIRQFVGSQTMTFATDAARKVTLIHGPNTVGKTTLLNAVYWCFYGRFLEGFLEPERLRSEQAKGKEYSVAVHFEHRGRKYIARRHSHLTPSPSDSILRVMQIWADGRAVPHEQPALLINSILPAPLASFFFFAGEMMKKGFATGANQGTATAIRAVLGLGLAELAIEDLKEIRKKRQKTLGLLSAGTDLADITNQLQEAESIVDRCTAQLAPLRKLIATLEADKQGEFDKLRAYEPSSKLQNRRDANIKLLKESRTRVKEAKLDQQQVISEFGSAVFLSEFANKASSLISTAVTKKRIPSPYDKAFVVSLLDSQVCICGRPVHAGSSEYQSVAALVNSATDENAIQNSLLVRGAAERVASGSTACSRALRRAQQRLQSAQSDVERYEQEEAMIQADFDKQEAGNVRESEKRLANIESTLRELVNNRANAEVELGVQKEAVARLRAESERARAASPQVADAKNAVDIIEKLVVGLERELELVEAAGLKRISEALNNIVANSTRQQYSAAVSKEYLITLFKVDMAGERKQVFVLSSGEQRLLDLCFLSALVAVCREREVEPNAVLLPGAVAPLMVDAPFGELDPEYQALAVSTMINLSEQLILMLSKTHWTDKVEAAVRDRVGKEYLLVGYKAAAERGAEPVDITIKGSTYRQIIYDAETDWTEIRAIGAEK